MPIDAAVLDGIPFFQLLDERERAMLAQATDLVRAPAGRAIFEYGDAGNALYIIRSGEVELSLTDDTGTRILLGAAGAGDFVGEISLLDDGPRTATALVTEDVEALVIDRDDLQRFMRHHPAIALTLLAVVGRRLRETNQRLRHTASRNVNDALDDTRSRGQQLADWVAAFSGSLPFAALNAVVFLGWIALNLGALPGVPVFDRPPFDLLTMAVSLEAIFLAIFVLVSQNWQATKDRLRSDIEYDINLKAELEIAQLHEKVDRLNATMQARLDGIERAVGGGRGA